MSRIDLSSGIAGFKSKNKKIFLQIDGLSYYDLILALNYNYMPTIKKLLKKGYKLHKVYSELPSNTPAAQMKIMYGAKDLIRGFRWYDKNKKEHYSFKNPNTADYFEKKVEAMGKKGILKDGASYINLYSGEAKRCILTLSKAFDTNVNRRLKSSEVWKFIFLNVDFIVILIYRLIKELIVEFYENIKYIIKRKPQRNEKFFPYIRLGNAVFFRDISVMGTYFEMNEATPKIYITFTAYDEIGHFRGSTTKEALKTLRGIDSAIRKIYKKAKLKGYEIYIFSDHGQTESIPFEDVFKENIRDFISKCFYFKEKVSSYNTLQENREFMFFYFLKKIVKGILEIGNRFFNIFANLIKKIIAYGEKNTEIQEELAENIIVTSSGPVSHIYFNKYKKRLNYDEIVSINENIIDNIVKHEGIEFCIVKDKDRYLILGKNGEIITDSNMVILSKKGNLLKNIFIDDISEEEVIKSLKEIISGDDAGDITIFGAVIGENKIINFEKQYGAHGGIGGPQNFPFIILKDEITKSKLFISDLYDIFL